MNNKHSFLTFLQEKMNEYEKSHPDFKDTHRNFIIMGVEFDENNYPEMLLNRAINNYSSQIAGLDLLKTMIDEDYASIKEKIRNAGKRNDNYKTAAPADPSAKPEVEDFMNLLRDKLRKAVEKSKKDTPAAPKEEPSSDDVLEHIKKQFGFDGTGNFPNDGSIHISGKHDDDDDDE